MLTSVEVPSSGSFPDLMEEDVAIDNRLAQSP
jgi:hypothetical protein